MEHYTYQDFTKKSSALDFEQAGAIYQQLVDLVELAGREAEELWADFLDVSVTYTARRARWLLLSRAEKVAVDNQRTNEHDAVIYTLTVVKRYLEQADLPTDWYEELTLNSVQARKRIGDFACYVGYVYGVNAR